MKNRDKNNYKGLAVMWFIFGCVFMVTYAHRMFAMVASWNFRAELSFTFM